jgi:hypothetical protein
MSTDTFTQTYSSALFTIMREGGTIVVMARTQQSLGTTRNLETALTAMRNEIQRASGGKIPGLLLDFRRAPSRIDEEFETAFARTRPHIYVGFTRVAYLMSSTLGKLQAQRYARDDGQGAQAFLNEKLAMAFVRPQNASHSA